MTQSVDLEKCTNCRCTIGFLETPCLWKEHVVCRQCHRKLVGGKSKPFTAAVLAALTVMAIYGAWQLFATGITNGSRPVIVPAEEHAPAMKVEAILETRGSSLMGPSITSTALSLTNNDTAPLVIKKVMLNGEWPLRISQFMGIAPPSQGYFQAASNGKYPVTLSIGDTLYFKIATNIGYYPMSGQSQSYIQQFVNIEGNDNYRKKVVFVDVESDKGTQRFQLSK